MAQGSDLLTGSTVTKRSVSGRSIRARLNSDQEVQPHVSSGAIAQKIPTAEDYGANVGRAVSGLGNVFGNVIAKIGAQEQKNSFANARLDFENADREIRDNIRKNPELVDGAPQLYDQTRSSIIKKYGFEKDPEKNLYFTSRTNSRVHHYADIKQKRAVEGFIANENSSIDKAVNAIVADPTPETRDRVLGSIDELVENSVGSFRTKEEALERKSELKDHLSLKYIQKLQETDPDKAEAELKAFKEQRGKLAEEGENQGKSIIGYSRGNLGEFKVAKRSDGKEVDVNHLNPDFRNKLAKLQEGIGKQLTINSGYRDPKYNAKVGGAKNSRHIHRDAVDLQWPKNASIEEKQKIIAMAKSLGFKGFGIGKGILHLDTGRSRFWGYKNSKPTSNIPGWAVDALSGKVKVANNNADAGIQGQIADAATKAGVDPEYLVRLASSESSFRPGVKADTSSATGLFQITGDTAKRLGTSHGKKSVEQEISDGIAITKANHKTMTNYLGRPPRNDELHLAHVFGAGRANGILSAKNETPIDKVLPPEVIQANKNGIFKTVKTVGQLKAWAKAKQNTKVDVAGSLQRAPVQSKRSKFVEGEITRLEKSIAKAREVKREQEFITGVMSGEIKVSGNDTEAMKGLNKAVNNKFGPDTDFAGNEEARSFVLQLAQNKAPMPKRFMQRMEGDLSSDTPETRAKAFQLLDSVEKANPSQFKAGVGSEKIGKQLSQYRFLSEFKGAEGAVKHMMLAQEAMNKMSADDMKAAKNKAIKEMDTREFLTDAFDDSWFSDPALGLTEKSKATISSEFERLFATEFDKTANAELSKASALHMIKSRYGVSGISGARAVMKYPPERFVSPEDMPHVQEMFQSDAAEVMAKHKPLLEAQGIKLIGEPILVADDETRQSVEDWQNGKTVNEVIPAKQEPELLMDGISQSEELRMVKTRALPAWRIAVKVEKDGVQGYHVIQDEYFQIEGLAKLNAGRLDEVKLRHDAKKALATEGKLYDGAPHNQIRKFFGYENSEVESKIEELQKQ